MQSSLQQQYNYIASLLSARNRQVIALSIFAAVAAGSLALYSTSHGRTLQMATQTKKTVVIVGGGGAAVALATQLETAIGKSPNVDIVLITGKEYHFHLIAGLRANVSSEDIAESICIPYDKIFKNKDIARVITKNATQVQPNKVILEDGQEIPFDYCVVATGKVWMPPSDVPQSRSAGIAAMKSYRAKVKMATNILVVGAGAVGLEIAGEIKESFPTKQVTIIQSSDNVLSNVYNNKFRNGLKKQAIDLGINFIFNDRLDGDYAFESGPMEVITQKSHKIPGVDLIIQATGGSVITDPIKTLVPADHISRNGVKVQPTFQLQDHPNIFAIGDLADLPEQKQLAKMPGHAAIASANIVALLAGKSDLKSYKGPTPKEMILVTLGSKGGMAYLDLPVVGPVTMGAWFASMVKGKSLFIDQQRKALGY